jgi:heparinase II/III-like protein
MKITSKNVEARLKIIEKKMKTLGLEARFLEFEEMFKILKPFGATTAVSSLESDIEEKLKWWETIFLNAPKIDNGKQKKWLPRLREALGFMSDKFIKHTGKGDVAAKLTMKNIFQLLNYKPIYLGHSINWNENPFGDREWPTAMNRHYFLLNLELEYHKTGDKKYAEKAKDLFLDWACCQPLQEWNEGRFGWSTLNAGVRGIVWPKLFCMWAAAGLLTGEFKKVAGNILIQNAEFLMRFKNAGPSNWRIFESEGLFYMSMILPGLERSNSWRKESVKRLKFEMERQIRKDGCHFQNCPSYHGGMLRAFYSVYLLADEAGIKNPFDNHEFLKTIEKMWEFSMYTSTPDFQNLPIGDSSPSDISENFAECEKLFDRSDFEYILSKGKKGVPPKKTSCALKPSGHIVFRNDWTKTARFLLFDIAEQVGCHSHRDAFNIHAWAYGKELICDSGRTTYKREDKAESEKTLRHNTVVVDGKNQNLLLPKLLKFGIKKNWGFIQAESLNYETVRHLRSIIFIDGKHWVVIDSLYSSDEHDYTLSFHTPQKKTILKKNKLIIPHMSICCESNSKVKASIEDVVIGRDYMTTAKAKALRFKTRAKNMRFVTLLATHEDAKKHPACTLDLRENFINVNIGGENYRIEHSEKQASCKIISANETIVL